MKQVFFYPLVMAMIIAFQPPAEAQEDIDSMVIKTNTTLLEQMMKTRNFILEADNLRQEASRSYNVQPNLNFVKVNDDNAVIQMGSTTGVGFNGLGGITIEGDVTDYELDTSDGNYNVNFTVDSPSGFFDVFVDTSDPQIAEARVSSIRGNQITFSGKLVPPSSASVTTGTPTY